MTTDFSEVFRIFDKTPPANGTLNDPVLLLNGVEVHSLAELREHFDMEQIVQAFLNGHLDKWLTDHSCERESTAVQRLERKDSPDLRMQLRELLGVSYPGSGKLTPEQEIDCIFKRLNLSLRTQDEEVLLHAMETATTQAELEELLNAGYLRIYLCGGPFSVPIHKAGVHYVGVGDPKVDALFTEEQYHRAGITFEGVALPEAVSGEMCSTTKNEYDSFADSRNPLVSLVHSKIKGTQKDHLCSLASVCDISFQFYKSKRKAETVAKQRISEVYDYANGYFQPGSENCLADYLAGWYADHLKESIQQILQPLRTLTRGDAFMWQLSAIQRLAEEAQGALLRRFNAELRENADYYSMYDRDYFLDKYVLTDCGGLKSGGVFEESSVLDNLLRTIMDDHEYVIEGIWETAKELDADVTKRANTFASRAYQEYLRYCAQIEKIAGEIGKDLSDDDLRALGLLE